MSGLRPLAVAALGVLRRDAAIFFSYRLRFAAQLLSLCFSLVLFHFISRLVGSRAFATPDDYYAFAVVGLVILAILNSSLAGPPAAVRQELVAGTFERLATTPFGAVGTLLAMLLWPFCYSLFTGAAMLAFAGAVFGLHVAWTAPLAIPLGALGALSFLPFGVLLLAATLLFKQTASGVTWVIAGISLVSGLYFPVSLLPGWIRWASDVQPFTPATDLLRHVLVDSPLHDALWIDLLRLCAFAGILLPVAVWLLGRAIDLGRRRGTLTEY